jgi:hypothetical protein
MKTSAVRSEKKSLGKHSLQFTSPTEALTIIQKTSQVAHMPIVIKSGITSSPMISFRLLLCFERLEARQLIQTARQFQSSFKV